MLNLSILEQLPAWFDLCYEYCFRVPAEQVGVAMIVDAAKHLPATVVAHFYVPKAGWTVDRQRVLQEKIITRLKADGIDVFLEVTDGAFNALRTEHESIPLWIGQIYNHQREIVQTWDREKCVSTVMDTVYDLIGIRLSTEDINQEVDGNIPAIPDSEDANKLATFTQQHSGNTDMQRIAGICERALQTRAACANGRSPYMIHFSSLGHPETLPKMIVVRDPARHFALLSVYEITLSHYRLIPPPPRPRYKRPRVQSRCKEMGIRGVGPKRAKALADLLHGHKDQLSSTSQVAQLLQANAVPLKIPRDVLERLASVVGFAPVTHRANKRALLQDIRALAVACTIPSYKTQLQNHPDYNLSFDNKTPDDLADVKFSWPKWCRVRHSYVLDSCCATHIFKALRMSIAHGQDHTEESQARKMHWCLSQLANTHPEVINHTIIDGAYEQVH